MPHRKAGLPRRKRSLQRPGEVSADCSTSLRATRSNPATRWKACSADFDATRLASILRRRQREGQALPDDVRQIRAVAVAGGALPVQHKRRAVVEIGGVLAEMFGQQLA